MFIYPGGIKRLWYFLFFGGLKDALIRFEINFPEVISTLIQRKNPVDIFPIRADYIHVTSFNLVN